MDGRAFWVKMDLCGWMELWAGGRQSVFVIRPLLI